jgi:N-acetylmuramoyl-L-alanine amidase
MKNKKKILIVIVALTIITIIGINSNNIISTFIITDEKVVVVIDPGHGGIDPGKVSVTGANEKDINLDISKKLAKYLEYQGITVVMTRTEDVGLYSSSSKNKKREDLRNRVKVINNSNPELVVSIHQNSFSQEKYKGAQTFYYASSEKSQQLAKYIQNSIKIFTDIENRRKIKPNKSYYLLKQSKTPIVIVECGFLSNYGEAKKLEDEEYQDKIAWAIYIGISAYINNISN